MCSSNNYKMSSSSKRSHFALLILILLIAPCSSKTIGPDLVARARLLRDLPISKTLSGQSRIAPKARNRTLIDMSLSVRSVDLDYATGVFKASGWMALKWNDPRYAWSPEDYEGLTSVPLPFSAVWAPEVILHNAVEEKFIHRQVGVVRHNGDLIYLVSVHSKSGCKPNFDQDDLGTFPFNVQTCGLQFGSWINEQYNVEYRVGNNSVNLDDFSSPTGWHILATKASLESVQYPMFEEPTHIVVFSFSFKRSVYYDPISGQVWKV